MNIQNIKIECKLNELNIDDLKLFKKFNSVDLLLYSNNSIFHPTYFSINFLNNIQEKVVNKSVLDLFSGSGVVGLTLSKANSYVDCVDISQDAIDIINLNIKINDIPNVHTIKSDLFSNVEHKYDVILGVPPMMSTEQYEKECNLLPREAYDAGSDMLNHYKHIFEQGAQYLNPNGTIYLPVSNDKQKQSLIDLLANSNWKYKYAECQNLREGYQYPCGYLEVTL